MLIDDTILGLAFGCGMLLFWFASVEYGAWLERRRPPTPLTPEDYERARRWLDIRLGRHHDDAPLIPPGTQTHRFTDIPDDDLLTPREGHPYT
jgi:hypothetical protein